MAKMIKVIKSTKSEKYIVQWWPYDRSGETVHKKATFTASNDEEACLKVFERLYGWQFEGQEDRAPQSMDELTEFFDTVDIGGDHAVVEITTSSGRVVYESGLVEEGQEDWDD